MEAPGLCMDANTPSNPHADPPENRHITMTACTSGDLKQVFYFDRQTREIKHDGLCLDQNTDTNDVYLHHDCHGGSNQKWYVQGNMLKNLHDDRCLDMATTGEDAFNLYMYECQGSENQKFIVPSMWLPDIYMVDVRVFEDRTKCMDAHPDRNNNVYMADCQVGNPNQRFYFDPR